MSNNLTIAVERHLQNSAKRFIERLRTKVADASAQLPPPQAKFYPGQRIPKAYTRLYDSTGAVTARRNSSGTGHEKSATLADPSTYSTPRNGSIYVEPGADFYWCETAIFVYASLTYSSDPSLAGTQKTFPRAGDLFDGAIDQNGGGLSSQAFGYLISSTTGHAFLNHCFDIAFYDKTRDQLLHDADRLPIMPFNGGNFANRALPQPVPIPASTEIEPRLYINEVRVTDILNADAAFNAAQLKVYPVVVMKGFLEHRS